MITSNIEKRKDLRAVTSTCSHPSAARSKDVYIIKYITIYTQLGTAPGYTTQVNNPLKEVENIWREVYQIEYYEFHISYPSLANNVFSSNVI